MPSTKRPFDFNKWIISVLKYKWNRSPQREGALVQALRPYGKYECAKCQKWRIKDEIEVDHIEPVIPVTGWRGFDVSIPRLFCPKEGLQILCLSCHSAKSKSENAERRRHKKGKS